MNRRTFLKYLGAATGLLLVAPKALADTIKKPDKILKGMRSGIYEVDHSSIIPINFGQFSSPDQVGIRRISVYIKRHIAKVMESLEFEKKDIITRGYLKTVVSEFLEHIKSRNGVYDYLVVCDEQNNSPEKPLTLDVYFKKHYGVEYIWLRFTL